MGAFDDLATGTDPAMVIVTAAWEGEQAGCLVGFSTQCSIDPARYLVCLSKNNRTYRVAQHAPALALHFLGRDDAELAALFGGRTGDETDKFTRCDWSPWRDGTPLLDDCTDRLVGRPVAWHDVGDHVAVVLESLDAQVSGQPRAPLRFSRVRHLEPGHEA